MSHSSQCRIVISNAGKTTEVQSLFVYGAGSNHDSYFDPSFEPQFERPATDNAILQRVTRMCQGIEECVYDYLLTGKLSVALGSANAVRQHEKVVEAAQTGNTNLVHKMRDALRYMTYNDTYIHSLVFFAAFRF